jgi:hypothetical protein
MRETTSIASKIRAPERSSKHADYTKVRPERIVKL